MPEQNSEGSAERVQREVNETATNKNDEQTAQEELERTGEPVRDALGNADGAS